MQLKFMPHDSLTELTSRYLRTLARVASDVPCNETVTALLALGFPASEPIVEFHGRYGGYIVPMTRPRRLGIAFRNARHIPRRPEARGLALDVWRTVEGRVEVCCADAPVVDELTIDETGLVTVANYGRVESFELHLGRMAVVSRLLRDPSWRVADIRDLGTMWRDDAARGVSPSHRARVTEERLREFRVPWLSDRHGGFFANDDILVGTSDRGVQLVLIHRRIDSEYFLEMFR